MASTARSTCAATASSWCGSRFAAGTAAIVLVTLVTAQPPEEKLKGLVYSGKDVRPPSAEDNAAWYTTPEFYAVVVAALFIALNVVFF